MNIEQKNRVLVATDDLPIGNLLMSILEEEKFSAAKVKPKDFNFPDRVHQLAPDVILLHHDMGIRTVNEVVAELEQARNGTPKISVIVLSAYPELVKPNSLIQQVITLPFDTDQLLQILSL